MPRAFLNTLLSSNKPDESIFLQRSPFVSVSDSVLNALHAGELQMAGNPRHFQTRAMSLLPPSYFVHKPTPKEDATQEPKEVEGNTEIQELKVENDRLR